MSAEPSLIKLYGTVTPDHQPLIAAATERLAGRPATIMCFARVPLGSKPCQRPGRLRLEVLIENTAYAVFQDPNGPIVINFS